MAMVLNRLFITVVITLSANGVYAAEPTAKDSLLDAVYLNDATAVKEHLLNPEMVSKELDPVCPQNTRCKPVTFAAENGSVEIMKLLLDAGANVEGGTGGTGDTPLILALMQENRDMINLLVERGADVNKPNNFGATPFWGACAMGDVESVKLFLAHKADVNYGGRFPDPLKKVENIVTDITPLMQTAFSGNIEITKLLLESGAKVDSKDSYGRTAKDYALASNNPAVIELIK